VSFTATLRRRLSGIALGVIGVRSVAFHSDPIAIQIASGDVQCDTLFKNVTPRFAYSYRSPTWEIGLCALTRAQESFKNRKPVTRIARVVIVVIWIALAALCMAWVYEVFMVRS
jgi:hypothetical protein